MTSLVVVLVVVGLVSWLGAVALAARAGRLELPWSLTSGGPVGTRRREQAAVARVWCIGLGAFSTLAVLGALAWAMAAPS